MSESISVTEVLDQTLAAKQAQALENAKEIASQNIVGFFEQGAQHTASLLTDLEAAQWLMGKGYRCQLFPEFTLRFEGLEPGFYIFAGESNSGKSAIMMNLFMDLVVPKTIDNHLYGIYFSLDDSKSEIFSRIIAMQQSIPIGAVKKPQVYQDHIEEFAEYGDYLAKRQAGYAQLIAQTSHVIVGDLTDPFAHNEEAMYNFIKKCKQDVQQIDPQGNILIAIDAIDDVRLKNPMDDKMTYLGSTLKRWAVDLDIVIFCSKHLKKLGANRRPCLDDLRDSNELVYEASAVLLVYNDVGKNKGAAKIYYEKEDELEKQPVIELNWAKNKKSSFKGLTFYHFVPNFSLLLECAPEDIKFYENMVYSL